MREFFLIFQEYLKSNMDRFIDKVQYSSTVRILYLKSNMDRFIAHYFVDDTTVVRYLKSNMDRFIEVNLKADKATTLEFKIQYG